MNGNPALVLPFAVIRCRYGLVPIAPSPFFRRISGRIEVLQKHITADRQSTPVYSGHRSFGTIPRNTAFQHRHDEEC
jgi:hypothetical protein